MSSSPPLGTAPRLGVGLWSQLSLMMFLQYAIWGAWLPLLFPFLSGHRGFTPSEIGDMFAVGAIGAILAPWIAGQVADRYFNTEKYLAIAHILGGVLVMMLAWISSYWAFLGFSLLYSLIYAPTLSLTNSLSFHHLPDRDRDFGRVRVWGTVGWIIVGISVGQWLSIRHTPDTEEITAQLIEQIADPDAEDSRRDRFHVTIQPEGSNTQTQLEGFPDGPGDLAYLEAVAAGEDLPERAFITMNVAETKQEDDREIVPIPSDSIVSAFNLQDNLLAKIQPELRDRFTTIVRETLAENWAEYTPPTDDASTPDDTEETPAGAGGGRGGRGGARGGRGGRGGARGGRGGRGGGGRGGAQGGGDGNNDANTDGGNSDDGNNGAGNNDDGISDDGLAEVTFVSFRPAAQGGATAAPAEEEPEAPRLFPQDTPPSAVQAVVEKINEEFADLGEYKLFEYYNRSLYVPGSGDRAVFDFADGTRAEYEVIQNTGGTIIVVNDRTGEPMAVDLPEAIRSPIPSRLIGTVYFEADDRLTIDAIASLDNPDATTRVTLDPRDLISRGDLTLFQTDAYGTIERESQEAGMADAFLVSGVLGILLGLFCLTLPKTPPQLGAQSSATSEALGEIRRQPLLTLFLLAVPISCIHQFYFVHTSSFLGEYQRQAEGFVAAINSVFGVGGGGLMTIGQMTEIAVLALIPLFAKKTSRKTLLAIGIAAYALRMFLFAYADLFPIPALFTIIIGVALHGLCFGCFIFVAFMIVDEESTSDVRASAQSLFNLVIVGVGIIVGSKIAGWVAEWATQDGLINYTKMFTVPMWGAVGCLAFLIFFYPSRKRGKNEGAA